MDEQLLKDFLETAKQNQYNWDVIMPKFPELEGIDLQLLKDYTETAIKYNYDYDVINPKFPEFFGEQYEVKKKDESTFVAPKQDGELVTEDTSLDTQETPETTEYQPQNLLEPIESEDAEFEASLKTSVTPEMIADVEESVVPEMQYKFGKYGFDFEATLKNLEHQSPLEKHYGYWRYEQQLVHTHHNAQTQNLLNRIVQIYTENHQDRNFMIDLAISELTVRLLRHQTRDFIIAHCENNPESNGLSAALANIHNNLAKPLDIDSLCKIACMSRTKFFHQFKLNLGCSPAAYQFQLRLNKAAQAIKSGQQITQVCFDLGFANASHFSRCFKQFYGLSPSAYKARQAH